MEHHPHMRIQFFLDGPFDPIESLSVSFLDTRFDLVECVVAPTPIAQYQLWAVVSDLASAFMARAGDQEELDLVNDETPGQKPGV